MLNSHSIYKIFLVVLRFSRNLSSSYRNLCDVLSQKSLSIYRTYTRICAMMCLFLLQMDLDKKDNLSLCLHVSPANFLDVDLVFRLFVSVESGISPKRCNQLTNHKPNICKSLYNTNERGQGKNLIRLHVSGLDVIRKNVIFHLNLLLALSLSPSLFFLHFVHCLVRCSCFLERNSCVCVCIWATLSSLPVTVQISYAIKLKTSVLKLQDVPMLVHSCCYCWCRCFYVRFDFPDLGICVFLCNILLCCA